MSDSISDEPDLATYVVDVSHAVKTLAYAGMDALAKMYARWAMNESTLDGNQRTKLIQLASDYERIAALVGKSWTASDPEYPPDAVTFAARLELREIEPEPAPSRADSRRNGSEDCDVVNGRILFDNPAEYLMHLVVKIIRLVPNCPRPQTSATGWKADLRSRLLANLSQSGHELSNHLLVGLGGNMRDNGENLHSGITHGCNVHRVEIDSRGIHRDIEVAGCQTFSRDQ